MIQSIPEGVDSKFRLVLLIARRAEQLMRGARPKLETDRPLKPTRLAAAEFGRGPGPLGLRRRRRRARGARRRGRVEQEELVGEETAALRPPAPGDVHEPASAHPPRRGRGHRRLQGGGGAPRADRVGAPTCASP